MNKEKILNGGLKLTKYSSLLVAVSSGILLYQASVLDKYNKILDEYNKVEKKDFSKISKNLIANYELESAKSLVSYTILDDSKKQELLAEISQKEDSTAYKIDSIKKCLTGKTNGSDLSNYCNNGIMFTPVGDVVDLIKEGTKNKEEEVDKITVGLSVLGLAATAGTIVSGGTSLAMKGVVSSIKKINKLHGLPSWLIKDITKIKKVDDINDELYQNIKMIGELLNKTDLDITGKLLKVTNNSKDLKRLLLLVEKHPDDIRNFMKISPDDFLSVYKKYGEKFDFNIYKQAFLIKGGFKMLEKQGVKGFTKTITKPKYPASKLRGIKLFEKTFGKIADLYEFIHNLILGLLSSIGFYAGASFLERKRKK